MTFLTTVTFLGWADEQIEGWRVMLERNVRLFINFSSQPLIATTPQPNKEKILQKHEFAGNQRGQILPDALTPGPSMQHGGHRGGRGSRGRGGGRGRGRGSGPSSGKEGGEGGRGDNGSARGRAWKDKNKASHGNHNRKRDHDKKMAKAGGPS